MTRRAKRQPVTQADRREIASFRDLLRASIGLSPVPAEKEEDRHDRAPDENASQATATDQRLSGNHDPAIADGA
jgi:hypothetical protein